ncbi:hypothetical protein ACIA8C_13735 [Nocardia sp. NPDC051321]|uniref:hypothetical protein n=1 Tax=Nocardia sp. NPDC051321 TaxID=3364323 RepID=UPI003794F120
MADTSGPSMTEAEIRQFFVLLQRYCDTELDQFEHLIIPTPWGDVYLDLTRRCPPDDLLQVYNRLPEAGP